MNLMWICPLYLNSSSSRSTFSYTNEKCHNTLQDKIISTRLNLFYKQIHKQYIVNRRQNNPNIVQCQMCDLIHILFLSRFDHIFVSIKPWILSCTRHEKLFSFSFDYNLNLNVDILFLSIHLVHGRSMWFEKRLWW
jgi:hypothetical protein